MFFHLLSTYYCSTQTTPPAVLCAMYQTPLDTENLDTNGLPASSFAWKKQAGQQHNGCTYCSLTMLGWAKGGWQPCVQETQSVFLYYYLLIFILFSTWAAVTLLLPTAVLLKEVAVARVDFFRTCLFFTPFSSLASKPMQKWVQKGEMNEVVDFVTGKLGRRMWLGLGATVGFSQPPHPKSYWPAQWTNYCPVPPGWGRAPWWLTEGTRASKRKMNVRWHFCSHRESCHSASHEHPWEMGLEKRVSTFPLPRSQNKLYFGSGGKHV